jgi:hypothetical protein
MIRVVGRWFAADCHDTGQAGQPPPLTGLHLQLSQNGRDWTVGTAVNASGPRYMFRTSIELPDDVRPGSATLKVENYGQGAVVQVTS